jgi:hypothetical protein
MWFSINLNSPLETLGGFSLLAFLLPVILFSYVIAVIVVKLAISFRIFCGVTKFY